MRDACGQCWLQHTGVRQVPSWTEDRDPRGPPVLEGLGHEQVEGGSPSACPGAAITMTKGWWLKTQEIHSLTALRPEVKIKVQAGLGSQEALGEEPPTSSSSDGSGRPGLWQHPSISASAITWRRLCVLVSSLPLLSLRRTHLGFTAHPNPG